ncbi:hypothetical protein HDU96_002713 [Phlyctochytrium bullatum]|nr:hypothetical protein HDU96_002713 [Phlyctochytrium bullatum]
MARISTIAAIVAVAGTVVSPSAAFNISSSDAVGRRQSNLARRQLGGGTFSGTATYYGADPGDPAPTCVTSCGACGPSYIPWDWNYFAAISISTFNKYSPGGNSYGNSLCGQCAHVTKDGRSVVVPIVDACPGCDNYGPYSLDLSLAAFGDLVGGQDRARQIGRMEIQWYIGDCGSHGAGKGQPSQPKPQPQPQPQPEPQPQPPSNGGGSSSGLGGCSKSYTIKSGDTCWALANSNGLSVDQFRSLNNNPDCQNLQIGQVQPEQPKPEPKPQPQPQPDPPKQPEQPSNGGGSGGCSKSHTIKSGDTCWALANANGLSVDQFRSLNNNPDCQNLQIGQVVCLAGGNGGSQQPEQPKPEPKPQPQPQPDPPKQPEQPSNGGGPSSGGCYKSYTIKSGDTCWALANANGLSVDQFRSLNNNPDCQNLQIGQVVCLAGGNGGSQQPKPDPKPEPQPTQQPDQPSNNGGSSSGCTKFHTIISGDTCWALANANGLSVDQLRALNNSPDCQNLQVGSTLCLASGSTPRARVAAVKAAAVDVDAGAGDAQGVVGGKSCTLGKDWRACDVARSGFLECGAGGIWGGLVVCGNGLSCRTYWTNAGHQGAYCA